MRSIVVGAPRTVHPRSEEAHVLPSDRNGQPTARARCVRRLFRGVLSLELFNRDYRARSTADNARTGVEKIRATVKKALA
jgi:hypothetical protein